MIRYVRALPSMDSVLSLSPLLRMGTVTTKLCMTAIGKELEFINIAAAVAKLLRVRHVCESVSGSK